MNELNQRMVVTEPKHRTQKYTNDASHGTLEKELKIFILMQAPHLVSYQPYRLDTRLFVLKILKRAQQNAAPLSDRVPTNTPQPVSCACSYL